MKHEAASFIRNHRTGTGCSDGSRSPFYVETDLKTFLCDIHKQQKNSGHGLVPWSVFEKWFGGSTGDPPVPSGDSPDGTGATVRANGDRLFATSLAAVPVGGSPTGAGGSPAPPIFKTGSYASKPKFPGQRQRSLYRLLRPSRRTIHGHLRDSFPNCSVALSAGGGEFTNRRNRPLDDPEGDLEEVVNSFIDPLDAELLALQEVAAVRPARTAAIYQSATAMRTARR